MIGQTVSEGLCSQPYVRMAPDGIMLISLQVRSIRLLFAFDQLSA